MIEPAQNRPISYFHQLVLHQNCLNTYVNTKVFFNKIMNILLINQIFFLYHAILEIFLQLLNDFFNPQFMNCHNTQTASLTVIKITVPGQLQCVSACCPILLQKFQGVVYIQIWSKSYCVITEAQDSLRNFWIL